MAKQNYNALRLMSYNCRGYNSYKREYLSRVIMNCDILYIQEHWLCTEQIGQLRDVSADFHVVGVSGFDNKEVLRGRPYGGTAILWRKDMHVCIDNIETHSRRVSGLHMYDNTYV